jgi:hypothetical protein
MENDSDTVDLLITLERLSGFIIVDSLVKPEMSTVN